jgi:hypothetical protein
LQGYYVLQLAVLIAETDDHGLKFLLQIADLSIQGIEFSLGLSLLADLEAVDLLSEHQHAILREIFGWMRDEVRE